MNTVSFDIVIIDSLKVTPKLKGRVAKTDSSGAVTVFCDECQGIKDIICKHMDGGSGDETVQCWQSDREYPIIAYFKQVTSLIAAQGQSDDTLTINCIASAFDVSPMKRIVLDYKQCEIYNDELKIGGDFVAATEGPLKINSLESGIIHLPKPTQDFLTATFSQGCNAKWTLHGDAAVNIMGSQLGPKCMVEAHGGKQESLLVVDLTSSVCVNRNVTLALLGSSEPRGIVRINEVLRVMFDSTVYTDIVIDDRTVDCNNHIHVSETSRFVKSIEINTFGGSDTIVIGSRDQPYEDVIHAAIIIDGGDGPRDNIVVHDGSTKPKNQTLSATSIAGIQEIGTFFYKGIESMDFNLGQFVKMEVTATLDAFELTIRYSNSNSNKILSTSTGGPINIVSAGNSSETSTR